MRRMWASFAAWLRLQHAADPSVSNKDVSVNPPSSSNSQETRKGRKNSCCYKLLWFSLLDGFLSHAAHRPHTHNMLFSKTWDP